MNQPEKEEVCQKFRSRVPAHNLLHYLFQTMIIEEMNKKDNEVEALKRQMITAEITARTEAMTAMTR